MHLEKFSSKNPKDQTLHNKKLWACPCNGCAKAVKQERQRIALELNNIDIFSTSSPNAYGLKLLMLKIINSGEK